MIKVMFVYHGNICCSPMATIILKDMLSKIEVPNKSYLKFSATSRAPVIIRVIATSRVTVTLTRQKLPDFSAT